MSLFDKARQQAASITPTTTTTARPQSKWAAARAAAREELSGLAGRITGTASITLGLAPMPHQQPVIAAVEGGVRTLLLADEMGVGKTLTAIGSVEAAGTFPALFIVPPSLTLNWVREINRALPHRKVVVLSGTKAGFITPAADIVICPDSIVAAWTLGPDPDDARKTVGVGPLVRHGFKCLVMDEAHRAKNATAQRTKAIAAISKVLPADALRLLASGTPMTNRPDELVPLLAILGVLVPLFGGRQAFLGRYCNVDSFGNTVSARNADELHAILTDTVMVRRLRKDVLSLPEKSRTLVPVTMDADSASRYRNAVKDLESFMADKAGADSYSIHERARAIVLLNALRGVAGEGKIEATVAMAEELLAAGEQVFIAAIHRNVVDGIWKRLRQHGCVTVVGGMTAQQKQDAVDAFQSGKARVLVGNIEAAGVGLTLTAARHIIVTELPWTPAALQQVEDRLHRIGQQRPVHAHILSATYEGIKGLPVDERLFGLIQSKARTINAIIDGDDSELSVEGADNIANELLDSYR